MSEQSFAELVDGLCAGDNDAARIVFSRFIKRLIGLAGSRLNAVIRQKQDPEDVVQSVFRTFFRRTADGEFEFQDWGSLWAILALITMRKCGNRVDYFYAARRDVHRDVQVRPNDSNASLAAWQGIAREPTPAEAAVLADMVDALMGEMDEQEKVIVSLRLQGCTIPEISAEAERSERTVSRILKRARNCLSRLEEED